MNKILCQSLNLWGCSLKDIHCDCPSSSLERLNYLGVKYEVYLHRVRRLEVDGNREIGIGLAEGIITGI